MEAVYFGEGRVAYENGVGTYQYYLTDHLGNNRVVFQDNGSGQAEIIQESHYYAFGMAMEGSWSQQGVNPSQNYLYNGKELNEDFGLGWYDYGFRMYDPAIARFTAIDPAAAKYSSISTYAYVANNPIAFVDPRGDTLRAVNSISGERALSLIQNSFNSVSVARGLFSLADDGITFNSISQKDINKATGSLSEDEAALFRGYAAAINGSETNVVEVLKRGETISEYGQSSLSNMITANDIDKYHGGGRKEQAVHDENFAIGGNGSYVAVLLNPLTTLTYSNGERPSLPGEILAHELLGHGLGDRGIRNNGTDASIQMGNAYLRATGRNYYRPSHLPESTHSDNFNPYTIPKPFHPFWKKY